MLSFFKVALGSLLFLALSCGKSSTKGNSKEVLPRSGGEVVSTGIMYLDDNPVLSDSGEVVAYISGRESKGDKVSLKAFRADWPAGQAPQNIRRITGQDVGQEQDVTLSPNGAYAVIRASKNGQSDLHLQDLAASQPAPVALTNDKLVETMGGFSPDSKLFAWMVRSDLKTQIKLIEIKQGAAAPVDLAAVVKAGAEFEGSSLVTWVPRTDGTYKLLIAKTKVGRLYDLHTLSFTSVAEAATATLQPLAMQAPYDKGVLIKNGTKPRATLTHLILTLDNSSSRPETIERLGDALVPENTTKEKIGVTSKPHFFEWSALAEIPITSATTEPLGFDAVTSSFTNDGLFGVFLNRTFFKCQEDPGLLYSTSLIAGDLTGINAQVLPQFTRSTVRFLGAGDASKAPREPAEPNPLTAALPWQFTLTPGLCGRSLGESMNQRIDQNIKTLEINGQGAKNNYRMIYSSQFVPKVDSRCETKIGDLEIRAMEWSNSAAKIYEVQPNRAPIEHAKAFDFACRIYW